MERYEQVACQEWEKLHKDSPLPESISLQQTMVWEYWLKAFEIAMSTYQWTSEDMLIAYEAGQSIEGESEDALDSSEWLQEYAQRLQTDQNTNS